MSDYRVIAYNGSGKDVDQKEADSLVVAQNCVIAIISSREDAFGDDREALERYGYFDAEDKALALSDEGGVIYLPDGWKIEVINTDDKE